MRVARIVYREVAASLCANDIDAQTDAVLAGLAIGQLVPLLTRHLTPRESIDIYYRHRTEQPLRVRTFIDFMIGQLAHNGDFFLSPAKLRALAK